MPSTVYRMLTANLELLYWSLQAVFREKTLRHQLVCTFSLFICIPTEHFLSKETWLALRKFSLLIPKHRLKNVYFGIFEKIKCYYLSVHSSVMARAKTIVLRCALPLLEGIICRIRDNDESSFNLYYESYSPQLCESKTSLSLKIRSKTKYFWGSIYLWSCYENRWKVILLKVDKSNRSIVQRLSTIWRNLQRTLSNMDSWILRYTIQYQKLLQPFYINLWLKLFTIFTPEKSCKLQWTNNKFSKKVISKGRRLLSVDIVFIWSLGCGLLNLKDN